jgi:hypothetical protein
MDTTLTFADMPHVAEEDELPFVLGLEPDSRPCVEFDGATIVSALTATPYEWPIGPFWLRARAFSIESDASYVAASTGSLINEQWPALRTAPPESEVAPLT